MTQVTTGATSSNTQARKLILLLGGKILVSEEFLNLRSVFRSTELERSPKLKMATVRQNFVEKQS
jgi:hypothetical protein